MFSRQNRYTPFIHFHNFYFFEDFRFHLIGLRKKSFLTGRSANFAQKSNSSSFKNLKWRWKSLKPLCYVEPALYNILRLSDCTWTDTFGFGHECNCILCSRFSESITYLGYTMIFFFTTYRQRKTTSRTAKKVLTDVVGQICDCWLVRRVLERKNAKRRRNAILEAFWRQ